MSHGHNIVNGGLHAYNSQLLQLETKYKRERTQSPKTLRWNARVNKNSQWLDWFLNMYNDNVSCYSNCLCSKYTKKRQNMKLLTTMKTLKTIVQETQSGITTFISWGKHRTRLKETRNPRRARAANLFSKCYRIDRIGVRTSLYQE